MNWNSRITERREALGLKKAALARQVGVSGATVTDWESGVIKNLAGENLIKVSAALKVSPEWLLSGKGGVSAPLKVAEPQAAYGPHGDLIAAWELLTDDERVDFLGQIKAKAAHNQAVVEQLVVRKRTVIVSERRGSSDTANNFSAHRRRDDASQ